MFIVVVLREVFDFVFNFMRENGKYTPSKSRLIFAGLALSYILTIIFTGFRLW